jgi:hypothetical protein
MRSTNGTATKLKIAASALVTCSALGVAAGCASQPQAVPVQAGNSSAAASSAASSAPARPARPAAEQIPESTELTVTSQMVPGTSSGTVHAVVVTSAATIKEIAADIDALPTLPHYGLVHCPMETVGTTLTLVFRDSAGGPELAQVSLGPKPTGECSGEIAVTVGGAQQPPLDDSGHPNFYAQLAQLAGLTSG